MERNLTALTCTRFSLNLQAIPSELGSTPPRFNSSLDLPAGLIDELIMTKREYRASLLTPVHSPHRRERHSATEEAAGALHSLTSPRSPNSSRKVHDATESSDFWTACDSPQRKPLRVATGAPGRAISTGFPSPPSSDDENVEPEPMLSAKLQAAAEATEHETEHAAKQRDAVLQHDAVAATAEKAAADAKAAADVAAAEEAVAAEKYAADVRASEEAVAAAKAVAEAEAARAAGLERVLLKAQVKKQRLLLKHKRSMKDNVRRCSNVDGPADPATSNGTHKKKRSCIPTAKPGAWR